MSTVRKTIEFFKMSLAGVHIEVECIDRVVFRFCRDYLSQFDVPDLVVGVPPKTLMAIVREEGRELKQQCVHADNPHIAVTPCVSDVELRMIHKQIADAMPRFDAFLVHGAVVVQEGGAYMFTAPSGTGKSTRARLWLKEFPGSWILNGDKPFLRIREKEVYACGSPWCGKENLGVNAEAPLRAVFLLERNEEGKPDFLQRLTPMTAFQSLLQFVHRPEDINSERRTVGLVRELAIRVPIYLFHSNPTQESIRLAWETAQIHEKERV